MRTTLSLPLWLLPVLACAQDQGANATDYDMPELESDIAIISKCDQQCLNEAQMQSISFSKITKKPVNGGNISSLYGYRIHPVLGVRRFHSGVDYAVPVGTKVFAAAPGRVKFVGHKGGYGKLVILEHGNHYSTVYGHLSDYANLKKGDIVSKGQVIAYSGNTGMSTGPHLHFEIRHNGATLDPLSGKQGRVLQASYHQSSATIPNAKTTKQRNGRMRTVLK
ncbi:M23 family metallopeptidase [Brackiella oedipodis]|uniref:M23 family metallopeptidase n=1 Tax=Brackiella oedipodis TaxID=124225 RepID=UPI00048DFC77|nr:M23 family metallopeptidase [Brackiella oedipodis]